MKKQYGIYLDENLVNELKNKNINVSKFINELLKKELLNQNLILNKNFELQKKNLINEITNKKIEIEKLENELKKIENIENEIKLKEVVKFDLLNKIKIENQEYFNDFALRFLQNPDKRIAIAKGFNVHFNTNFDLKDFEKFLL